mmetsp:Transcript_16616/g.24155  ORF Transcript_16616/g.24155 Transcript_16616/m.24155 type:complete len:480 (+) Transcript_16616:40-1479(+)
MSIPTGTCTNHSHNGINTATERKMARIQIDCSQSTVEMLCTPFDDNVLNDENLLRSALLSPLNAKIPVDRLVHQFSGLAVDSVFMKCGNGEEACIFVDRFVAFDNRCAELRVGMSELSVQACVTEVTGMMWRKFALYLNLRPSFKVLYNKNDLIGSTEGDGKPNETDYLNDFMVCKSEHNDFNIQKAVSELTKKLTHYSHVEYGPVIVFLPVIAAAGTDIEFAFVDVRTKVYHRIIRYDLCDVLHRVQCFVRMINVFRLIHTMSPYIPTNPTPLFTTYENITYYHTHVLKKLSGNITCPDELYDLLSKGEVPNAVRVKKRRDGKLKVTPCGIRTPNRGQGLSLKDVQAAIKAVLSCLAFMHSKDFVHRDIKWANLIRFPTYRPDGSLESRQFLVIDFECAAMDKDEMFISNYIHKEVVPFGAEYRTVHDLQLVGKLVETWADINGQVLDQTARDFINSVKRVQNPLNASTALQHAWLLE